MSSDPPIQNGGGADTEELTNVGSGKRIEPNRIGTTKQETYDEEDKKQ